MFDGLKLGDRVFSSRLLLGTGSGATDAKEAIRPALLGRELTGSPFIKLEIHPHQSELATATSPLTAFLAGRTR